MATTISIYSTLKTRTQQGVTTSEKEFKVPATGTVQKLLQLHVENPSDYAGYKLSIIGTDSEKRELQPFSGIERYTVARQDLDTDLRRIYNATLQAPALQAFAPTEDGRSLSFPNCGLKVEFQRTIRVPDDGKERSLPPGLGAFPVAAVMDDPSTLAIPMYVRNHISPFV